MKFLMFVTWFSFSMSSQAMSLKEKILDAIQNGATELHIAVIKQDSAEIKALVNKGVYIDVKDDFEWTPLFYAVDNSLFNIAIELFNYKADPNVKDEVGWTPLHLTREVIMAKILILAGADIHAETSQGRTALDLNKLRENTEMISFLLEKEKEKTNLKQEKLF